jgi:maltokinase
VTSDGLVTASYAADEALLAELRAAWPPGPSPLRAGSDRGYVTHDLAAHPPTAAIRLSDRFAVALAADGDRWRSVPLAGFGGRWWQAAAGDGPSAFVAGAPAATQRTAGVDQTNHTGVVGERVGGKWLRWIGPEPSRAATLLAHLDAVGFAEIPRPLGAVAWRTPDGRELALAHGDAWLPGARDGWEWVVERLERHVAHAAGGCPAGGCDAWIGADLGRLIARLHAALRTPSAVVPEPIARARRPEIASWRATAARLLEEAIELTPPDGGPDPGVAELAGAIRAALGRLPPDGPIELQPVHGDLHVGQVLEWPGGLAVIDFDGNPALGPEANALRQPAERDIAQMASSLDHVGRVAARAIGDDREAAAAIEAWIARTRRDLLGALDGDPDRLAAFEAEQELREIVYAARFLPRWRYAPLATLRARYGPPVADVPRSTR